MDLDKGLKSPDEIPVNRGQREKQPGQDCGPAAAPSALVRRCQAAVDTFWADRTERSRVQTAEGVACGELGFFCHGDLFKAAEENKKSRKGTQVG